MIGKPIDSISATDIQSLIDNQAQERRVLEFKRDLIGSSDKEKLEFRCDVSSFANAAGGDLIFGVAEKDGVAVEITGIGSRNPDEAILHLEQIAHSGIDPRVPGLQTRAVRVSDTATVIVMRVPRSWRSPHLVKHNDSFRMYTRASAGKMPMDASDIRSSFASQAHGAETIRRWRDERLARIIACETPVPCVSEPRFVLHLIPESSMFGDSILDARLLARKWSEFAPFDRGSVDWRLNIDGLVTSGPAIQGKEVSNSYCQVFRSGRVEALLADLAPHPGKGPSIPSVWFEREVGTSVSEWSVALHGLDCHFPMHVFGAVLNARGAYMNVGERHIRRQAAIDRDVLVLSSVELSAPSDDVRRALRPMFDSLWNACGMAGSFNYNAAGDWNPQA